MTDAVRRFISPARTTHPQHCDTPLCGCMAVWLCVFAALRLCGSAALRLCGSAALRLCGSAALRLCGSVALWLCGSVALRLWLCGSVALRLCGSAALRLCVPQRHNTLCYLMVPRKRSQRSQRFERRPLNYTTKLVRQPFMRPEASRGATDIKLT